jgi:hypothetical protein
MKRHFHQLTPFLHNQLFTFALSNNIEMKKMFCWLVITTPLLFACSKKVTNETIPECVSKDIQAIEKNIKAIGPIVNQYTFQENTVYLIDEGLGFADSQSKVVDSKCNELGYLGGIMGNTKINGDDFFISAVYVKTVWKR